MSSGGRLLLTNTSLSSLPIYTMGMYRLQDTIHQQMDSIRAKFFWQGAGENFQYHMVKWPNLCLPTDFGGLGILDTRLMNDALIGKWGWRMLKADENYLCYQLLKKYLRKHSFLQCQKGVGSQFWKGVLQTRGIIQWGCQVNVNNGLYTRFW